jgi:hypothetical protein
VIITPRKTQLNCTCKIWHTLLLVDHRSVIAFSVDTDGRWSTSRKRLLHGPSHLLATTSSEVACGLPQVRRRLVGCCISLCIHWIWLNYLSWGVCVSNMPMSQLLINVGLLSDPWGTPNYTSSLVWNSTPDMDAIRKINVLKDERNLESRVRPTPPPPTPPHTHTHTPNTRTHQKISSYFFFQKRGWYPALCINKMYTIFYFLFI